MNDTILVFDPGESTGWVFRDGRDLIGGTLPKSHLAIAEIIDRLMPDVVVVERFNLYPGMAQSLSWNSFYPVEVIGVIKYMCMKESIPIIEQAPSVKKYAGALGEDWKAFREESIRNNVLPTEHTKDAFQHLKYYELRQRDKKKV